MRILTEADVADLIDLQDAMDCLERAFTAQAEGSVVAWPPLHHNDQGTNFLIRSGALLGEARLGVTLSTGGAGSRFAVLYEAPSGRPLCFMGYPFSGLRLNATVGLGVARLAKPNATRVALLGTGRRALGLLRAVCSVRPVQSITVYSPTVEHRREFAPGAEQALGVPVRALDDPAAVVAEADVVVVMTNARRPALLGSWLPPNALVAAAGQRSELDEDVFLRTGLIVTTSREQELGGPQASDRWTLVRLTRRGAMPMERIAELGEVLVGKVTPPAGITVFRDAQGGFLDIALAAHAFERAVALGRGQEWSPVA